MDERIHAVRGEAAAISGKHRYLSRRPSLSISSIVFIGGEEDRATRARVFEAMLVSCGELGYRQVTVEDVLERSDCSRVRFHRLFRSKEHCYLEAATAEAVELYRAMLGAAPEETSWRGHLRAALSELARFTSERPRLARGLLVEVRVAGKPALVRRRAMMERLSRAIDSARRENGSRHSPPPITAEFIVCAIEEAVVAALVKGEDDFAEAIPELAYLAVAPYFGKTAAAEDMAALRSRR